MRLFMLGLRFIISFLCYVSLADFFLNVLWEGNRLHCSSHLLFFLLMFAVKMCLVLFVLWYVLVILYFSHFF